MTDIDEIPRFIDKSVKDLRKKLVKTQERQLITDIIKIYKGVYKDYDEYLNKCVRLNAEIRAKNNSYVCFIAPEVIMLSEDVFEFLKNFDEEIEEWLNLHIMGK